jgi:glycosyltransferase involved in cell wall biosynthesis
VTDVVVCAHNEATRMAPVLDAIRSSPFVSSLIVVADSCTDNTAELAGRWADQVIPIDAANKGTAMAVGLSAVGTPLVLFMDADLTGLRPGHVGLLCTLEPLAGMLVGVRGNTVTGQPIPKVLGSLPSISGERRVPTDFARSLALAGSGWRAETLFNVGAMKQGLPHRQIMMRGVANSSKMIRSPWAWAKEAGQVFDTMASYGPELWRYMLSEQAP